MMTRTKITIIGFVELTLTAIVFGLYLLILQFGDSGDLLISDDLNTGICITMLVLAVLGLFTFVGGFISMLMTNPYKTKPVAKATKK